MKVLVSIDNSKFSGKVIREIASRHWSADTEFLVLSVVQNCSLPGSTERFVQQRKIMLESVIATVSKKLKHCKLSCEVLEGNAASEIISMAEQWHADLIIMGAHGESGISRRKIGNVVMSVLTNAPCSMEIVKPRKAMAEKRDLLPLKTVSRSI